MIDVIYLAGGKGIRAGLGYPKQFARIGGKPIMVYGLEILNKINEIENIIIPSSDKDRTFEILNNYNIDNFKIIENGETRQESVYKGLKYINTEYVLICEAVRPFMSKELLNIVIESDNDIVVPKSISTATIVRTTPNINNIITTIERSQCGMVQMPQKFKTEILKECHEVAITMNKIHTDDLALVLDNHYNTKYDITEYTKIIDGEEQNIKITTPLDLHIAEAILKYKAGDKIE